MAIDTATAAKVAKLARIKVDEAALPALAEELIAQCVRLAESGKPHKRRALSVARVATRALVRNEYRS